MKRIIPFVAAVLVALSAQAQTVNVHMADGTTQTYLGSQVEYINFNATNIPDTLKAVDLGLPSKTKWASINIGADIPEGDGFYFSWGEIEPKTRRHFGWENYKYGYWDDNLKIGILTKYNSNDGLTTLEPSDDAATMLWGEEWCIPTKDDFEELIANTDMRMRHHNGIPVVEFKSKSNDKAIILPAAGYNGGQQYNFDDTRDYAGFYYTSTLDTSNNCMKAYSFIFSMNQTEITNIWSRPDGYSIRPVKKNKKQ